MHYVYAVYKRVLDTLLHTSRRDTPDVQMHHQRYHLVLEEISPTRYEMPDGASATPPW